MNEQLITCPHCFNHSSVSVTKIYLGLNKKKLVMFI